MVYYDGVRVYHYKCDRHGYYHNDSNHDLKYNSVGDRGRNVQRHLTMAVIATLNVPLSVVVATMIRDIDHGSDL